MKTMTCAALCALALLPHAGAQMLTEAQEKLEVVKVMRKHASTVACGSHFEVEKSDQKFLRNVYPVERHLDAGVSIYYILWDGDLGCNGGSGTHSFLFSEVGRYSESRPFLVMSNDAFGEVKGQSFNPRFISKVTQLSASRFVIISAEHADKDGNNFPSRRYSYELTREDGKWRVSKRTFLGAISYN